jgi:peptidyl-tRNA hydrolase, PTH2 family
VPLLHGYVSVVSSPETRARRQRGRRTAHLQVASGRGTWRAQHQPALVRSRRCFGTCVGFESCVVKARSTSVAAPAVWALTPLLPACLSACLLHLGVVLRAGQRVALVFRAEIRRPEQRLLQGLLEALERAPSASVVALGVTHVSLLEAVAAHGSGSRGPWSGRPFCAAPAHRSLREPATAAQPKVGAVSRKLAVVVRADLGMSKGKIAAQAAHAAVAAVLRSDRDPDLVAWLRAGQPKVVLRVGSEAQLRSLCEAAEAADLPVEVILDAGRTQVDPGTPTCCAIGPAPDSAVDSVTGSLQLL